MNEALMRTFKELVDEIIEKCPVVNRTDVFIVDTELLKIILVKILKGLMKVLNLDYIYDELGVPHHISRLEEFVNQIIERAIANVKGESCANCKFFSRKKRGEWIGYCTKHKIYVVDDFVCDEYERSKVSPGDK